ncbi:MAG: WYL domain-containing protein, partial [Terrimesophilobacter sp.]
WESQLAHVMIEPETDAAIRLAKQRGATEADGGGLNLHFVDLNIVADELASYGPEVLVVSPPELRVAVLQRLHATAAAHA